MITFPFLGGDVTVYKESQTIGGSFAGKDAIREMGLIKKVYNTIKNKDKPIMVDVGASTGSYSLIAKFIPGLTIHAFEPYGDVAALLLKNIWFNNVQDRVTVYNIACFNKTGVKKLKCCLQGHSGFSSLGDKFNLQMKYENKLVRTDTLDNILFNRLEKLNFLKIDTEGSDLYVLLGAEKLIKKFKPAILVEDRWAEHFGYNKEEISRYLCNLGYKVNRVSPDSLWAV